MGNLVEIMGLTKKYDGKTALNNISFTIPAGRIVGLLGPNGAGKTTILKILAGVMSDYQGSVKIGGMPVGAGTKSIVSYLPDKTYLSSWMKVGDTVDLFRDFYEDFDAYRAKELLRKLGIGLEQKVSKLSKGNYEKVQLVIVMSRRARLYVLDEPLGGVDPASRDVIIDTILTNYSDESTLLISTHLISDIERVFDSVIMLRDQQILIDDDVDSVREKYGKSIDELFREVYKC